MCIYLNLMILIKIIRGFISAQRGFIAPLLDEGILRDANGKPYYLGEDYKFDINAPAPETVNPSL